MAVGDVVGLTGSTFTFQPAATVEVLVSNYTHIGIGYWIANPMNRTFINNANFIEFGGSGTKGFTGIQIA